MLGFWMAMVVVIALVALSFGVLVLVHRARYTRLRRAPRTRIADLKTDGLFKIAGNARLLNAGLEAPMTGARCIFYRLTVDEAQSEEPSLVSASEVVPFLLEDESASIRVEPIVFDVLPASLGSSRHVVRSAQQAPFLSRYLDRAADKGLYHGALAALRREARLIVDEAVIREGASLVLYGQAEYRRDADGAARFIFTCPDDRAMLISEEASEVPEKMRAG